MTNDEVSDWLYRIRSKAEVFMSEAQNAKSKEAVATAIEALSKVNICHNMNTDYDSVDQFVCSECGIELQDWNRVEREDDGEIIYHEYHLRYCPNCGRKIEDE